MADGPLVYLCQIKPNMKRNVFNILLLSGVAIAFSSCKDDDDKKETNIFKVGTISTTIKSGTLIYDTSLGGENNDIYRHELVLIGPGLSMNEDETIGEGNGLVLDLVSSTTTLEPGTYNFTGTDVGSVAFDLWDGDAYIDLNTQEEQAFAFSDGAITVAKSGDVYTIDVSGVSGETVIEGHFEGKLGMVEDL